MSLFGISSSKSRALVPQPLPHMVLFCQTLGRKGLSVLLPLDSFSTCVSMFLPPPRTPSL